MIIQELVYVPKLNLYVDRYMQTGNGQLLEHTDIYNYDIMKNSEVEMKPIPNKIPMVTLNINGQEVPAYPMSAIVNTSWEDNSNLEKLTLTINSFKFDVYAKGADIRGLIVYLNKEAENV